MRTLKAVFSALTILFGFMGLAKIGSYDISMPLMFLFLGLTFLTNAKECYDKGTKRDAAIFLGLAVFIGAVTAYKMFFQMR